MASMESHIENNIAHSATRVYIENLPCQAVHNIQ